jgi:hypothetical protein
MNFDLGLSLERAHVGYCLSLERERATGREEITETQLLLGEERGFLLWSLLYTYVDIDFGFGVYELLSSSSSCAAGACLLYCLLACDSCWVLRIAMRAPTLKYSKGVGKIHKIQPKGNHTNVPLKNNINPTYD